MVLHLEMDTLMNSSLMEIHSDEGINERGDFFTARNESVIGTFSEICEVFY